MNQVALNPARYSFLTPFFLLRTVLAGMKTRMHEHTQTHTSVFFLCAIPLLCALSKTVFFRQDLDEVKVTGLPSVCVVRCSLPFQSAPCTQDECSAFNVLVT